MSEGRSLCVLRLVFWLVMLEMVGLPGLLASLVLAGSSGTPAFVFFVYGDLHQLMSDQV